MENIPPTQVKLFTVAATATQLQSYFFYRQLYFSIVIEQSTSAVFGVKAFRLCKMHHRQNFMAGKKMDKYGDQYGHSYQRQLKPAENY